ncbi:1-acyl-sn-glycerol-3-phosphate acyltransferase [Lutibaculum baratangense AMV1]|uniref:1-acyl-sn-glycerol-3-phosphate acyltransferase n=1 Tax=Lutibaculum baratangense AMV1 TaxID=631454 RepID=V4QW18_9HYPH|nr:1-acyl-sn-glycerol-3-phosphate acyltransferase [Lutibaculum baratangense AMV1]
MRSILFNLLFYLNVLVQMIVFMPALLLPRRVGMKIVTNWAKSCVWLLRVVGGVKLEVRGESRRRSGPALVAAKHQSVFETFALIAFFEDPAFILKHELNLIPLFGWWSARMRMIAVRRGKRSAALKEMTRVARDAARSGRQVIIFPEGTRRSPGAPPQYKIGIAHLYESCGVECLPVALNTGLFWPRRSPWRFPGTAVIEFLPPIPPGLERMDFIADLEGRIEAASDRLLLEAAQESPPPPLPSAARERLAELGAQAACDATGRPFVAGP